MTTAPGSVVRFIYRFSPLQNIENGYTALINGLSIGWGTYAFLLLLAVCGFVLNLLVSAQKESLGEPLGQVIDHG